jgi:hypothetical protein
MSIVLNTQSVRLGTERVDALDQMLSSMRVCQWRVGFGILKGKICSLLKMLED